MFPQYVQTILNNIYNTSVKNNNGVYTSHCRDKRIQMYCLIRNFFRSDFLAYKVKGQSSSTTIARKHFYNNSDNTCETQPSC